MIDRLIFSDCLNATFEVVIEETLAPAFDLMITLLINAQIAPNITLGAENSIVTDATEDVLVCGALADFIAIKRELFRLQTCFNSVLFP